MYCYVRNALPRVRLVTLVRSCYVFLLSCYLGGIVIVRPFLQKNKKNIYIFVVGVWLRKPYQGHVSFHKSLLLKHHSISVNHPS
jgi:hypothetical protein